VNQTIVASALPTSGAIWATCTISPWVIIAYLLSSTVVAPLYGKLSDIHGRRAMMLAAVGLFVAGSALSAVAPNMTLLIVDARCRGSAAAASCRWCRRLWPTWWRRASAACSRPIWALPGSSRAWSGRCSAASSPTGCIGQ